MASFSLGNRTQGEKCQQVIHQRVKDIPGKVAEEVGNQGMMMVESNKWEVLGFQNMTSKAFGKENQFACDC